jgi:hypothetical protein
MNCIRCHGSMNRERLYDWLENDGQFYVSGWRWVSRCIDCGHVTDRVLEPQKGHIPRVRERETFRYEG